MKTNGLSELFSLCLSRDKHKCKDCDSKESLEVHHILPISQGGKNALSNLKTVCRNCHKENYKHIHYPKDKALLVPEKRRETSRSGLNKHKYTRVFLPMTNELLEKIERYWHQEKLKNRNEAIKKLVTKGLD